MYQYRAMTASHENTAQDLCAFIDASPSPFHVVDTAAQRLLAAGFEEISKPQEAENSASVFLRRDGALLAAAGTGTRAVKIVGAHTDSPNLRLKPTPDQTASGWRTLGIEVYGGTLNNTWLDRDLGCSGRLMIQEGNSLGEVLVLLDRPVARIPQLAIHLDQGVNEKGLILNRQQHLRPLLGLGDGPGLLDALAQQAEVKPEHIVSFDLMLHDLTPATLAGLDQEFISAPRLDNQLSCHAGLGALLAAQQNPGDNAMVLALYDHEEVGSTTATGASGPLLNAFLAARCSTETLVAPETLVISADGAHATHPNYPDRHDPDHQVFLNQGPVLKHNANQRYATDAPGAAQVHQAAEKAGVPLQTFVSRSDLACGSTIGPLTAAATGLRTVDLGAAQLAMHSARELCGSQDPEMLKKLLVALLCH